MPHNLTKKQALYNSGRASDRQSERTMTWKRLRTRNMNVCVSLSSVTCMLHHATQPEQKASVVQQSPSLWPTEWKDHDMKTAADTQYECVCVSLSSVTCMLHHATQPEQKASVVQQSPSLWPREWMDHEMKRAAVKMQLQTRNMNVCVCPSAV